VYGSVVYFWIFRSAKTEFEPKIQIDRRRQPPKTKRAVTMSDSDDSSSSGNSSEEEREDTVDEKGNESESDGDGPDSGSAEGEGGDNNEAAAAAAAATTTTMVRHGSSMAETRRKWMSRAHPIVQFRSILSPTALTFRIAPLVPSLPQEPAPVAAAAATVDKAAKSNVEGKGKKKIKEKKSKKEKKFYEGLSADKYFEMLAYFLYAGDFQEEVEAEQESDDPPFGNTVSESPHRGNHPRVLAVDIRLIPL